MEELKLSALLKKCFQPYSIAARRRASKKLKILGNKQIKEEFEENEDGDEFDEEEDEEEDADGDECQGGNVDETTGVGGLKFSWDAEPQKMKHSGNRVLQIPFVLIISTG